VRPEGVQNKNRPRLSRGSLICRKNEQERGPYSSEAKVAQFPSPRLVCGQAMHTDNCGSSRHQLMASGKTLTHSLGAGLIGDLELHEGPLTHF